MSSFLDTNVLIYVDSGDEPVKREAAAQLIRALVERDQPVISTQVLQEFVNVAWRKLKLPAPLIRERLATFSKFQVVALSPELIASAFDLHVLRSLSFYDALIVQAAVSAGCSQLYSEDLQSGATIGGVRIRSPFANSP